MERADTGLMPAATRVMEDCEDCKDCEGYERQGGVIPASQTGDHP